MQESHLAHGGATYCLSDGGAEFRRAYGRPAGAVVALQESSHTVPALANSELAYFWNRSRLATILL
jgi:hypothetical protein